MVSINGVYCKWHLLFLTLINYFYNTLESLFFLFFFPPIFSCVVTLLIHYILYFFTEALWPAIQHISQQLLIGDHIPPDAPFLLSVYRCVAAVTTNSAPGDDVPTVPPVTNITCVFEFLAYL